MCARLPDVETRRARKSSQTGARPLQLPSGVGEPAGAALYSRARLTAPAPPAWRTLAGGGLAGVAREGGRLSRLRVREVAARRSPLPSPAGGWGPARARATGMRPPVTATPTATRACRACACGACGAGRRPHLVWPLAVLAPCAPAAARRARGAGERARARTSGTRGRPSVRGRSSRARPRAHAAPLMSSPPSAHTPPSSCAAAARATAGSARPDAPPGVSPPLRRRRMGGAGSAWARRLSLVSSSSRISGRSDDDRHGAY